MKRLNYFIHSQEGFTLTEVIVTIMIFSIVVGVIFSFLRSGLDTYTYGNDLIKEQASLRLAMYKLTDEVRNATDVEIVSDTVAVAYTDFIHVDNDRLIHNDNGTDIGLSEQVIDSVEFDLKLLNGKYVLLVTMEGTSSETITSEILLNNISGTATAVDGTGADAVLDFTQP